VGGGGEGGGAFSVALKVCFKKCELHLHYHQNKTLKMIFFANPRNKKFVKNFERHV
jgi:hypothetical protein